MQDFERSQLAEQNRQIIALLAKIEKQGREPTLQELKTESPDLYEYVKLRRVREASLGECVQASAEALGFANETEYIDFALRAHEDKGSTYILEAVERMNEEVKARQ
ncbi:hypothetical protein [Nitrososphaera sp.]|uniref:hypothetical protein n=1 Tax=Nitrososphaera sp. TaxID=1971748 RepID=UPI00316E9DBC